MKEPMKNLEEINIDTLDFEEPSIDEQIRMATRDLEEKNNDLIQKLYYQEQEIEQLRRALKEQADCFDKTVSKLVQSVFGPIEM